MGSYFPKLFEFHISYQDENFDSLKTFTEYIIGFGYRIEEHKVLTKDNYILTLFRIPGRINDCSRNKKPIFLMHGAFDSAFTFFINSKNYQNLPFILSDEGYDVWIGNIRGNQFSYEHIDKKEFNYLNVSSKYWEFSLDECSKYDLTSLIDYILHLTKYKKLIYIGHSQGAYIFFLLACENLNYVNSKISKFIGLAPVLYTKNTKCKLFLLISFLRISEMFYFLGIKNFFNLNFLNPLKALIFRIIPHLPLWIFPYILGKTKKCNLDFNRISLIGKYGLAGSSTKLFCHFFQNHRTDKIQKYDYGLERKIKSSNSKNSLIYNLLNISKLKSKKLCVLAQNDLFSCSTDYKILKKLLEPDKELIIEDYNHNDLLWADTAYLKVYPQIIEWIKYKESKEVIQNYMCR